MAEQPTFRGGGPAFRPGEQHPEPWRSDLNPAAMAGQNVGTAGRQPEASARSAHELKELHARLRGFPDDVLKQIPVLPAGTRLEQGATYVDLASDDWRELTATGDMVAGPDTWYVPKTAVDYQLWNRLIGVTNPERLGLADER